jgi:hypothetical protein
MELDPFELGIAGVARRAAMSDAPQASVLLAAVQDVGSAAMNYREMDA